MFNKQTYINMKEGILFHYLQDIFYLQNGLK